MDNKESLQDEWIEDTLYGVHPVLEALAAGRKMDKILLKKGIEADTRSEIMEKAKKADVQVQFVPPEKIAKVCPRGANHQGVAAFISLVEYTGAEEIVMKAFDEGKVPMMVMLDQVSDVRNFAAIARTAECLGATGIIIPQMGAARINAEAMKISSGALNHLPVSRVSNLGDTLLMLKEYGLRIFSCSERGGTKLFDADLKQPVCIILGSEDEGISPKLIRLSDEHIKIPLSGNISSLNVSVAAAILMMETIRQRQN